MIVTPLVPDAPVAVAAPSAGVALGPDAANAFGAIVDSAARSLDTAATAETRFAAGSGGLQEMVVARAHADIALQVAATAAARAAQSLQALFGISV